MATTRRTFLKAGLASAAGTATAASLGAPAVAQQARVLKFIPQSNLTVLDPIWTTANVTRHHGFMVYDTLFATDAQFRVKPQMAEGFTLSDDRRTYTIRLREGLKFHDGEPVRARDCIASLNRWSKRDSFGQTWAEHRRDARGRRPDVRGQAQGAVPAVHRRDRQGGRAGALHHARAPGVDRRQHPAARGRRLRPLPLRARGVRRRQPRDLRALFDGYVPRQEPVDVFAGGKVAHFDRVECIVA
jgi:peptide/nickel transport system substrate-binding protein